MHSNVNIPMRLKSNITFFFYQNGITSNYLGFWEHYMAFLCFYLQNVLFAITAYFLSFPDKNLWFSSQKKKGRSCWGC